MVCNLDLRNFEINKNRNCWSEFSMLGEGESTMAITGGAYFTK